MEISEQFDTMWQFQVSQVMDYVKKLINTRHNKVLPKEIGIITPYRQQVTKVCVI